MQTHEVSSGETIDQLAKQYRVSSVAIRKLNHLKSNKLRVGQELLIPKLKTVRKGRGARRVAHRVRKGETLVKIARAHGMTLAALRRLNPGIKNPLPVGLRLWVKGVRDYVSRGSIKNLSLLETGPGFEVMDRKKAWGTRLTVNRIQEVLTSHHKMFPNASPLLIGDISKNGGGYLAPHRSHRRGRDVDIRYPLLTPTPKRGFVIASKANLDIERTWSLVRAFIDTDDVEYIFIDYQLQKLLRIYGETTGIGQDELSKIFQFPHGRRSQVGIIRHEKGHKTHLHVRFRKDVEEQKQIPTS